MGRIGDERLLRGDEITEPGDHLVEAGGEGSTSAGPLTGACTVRSPSPAATAVPSTLAAAAIARANSRQRNQCDHRDTEGHQHEPTHTSIDRLFDT